MDKSQFMQTSLEAVFDSIDHPIYVIDAHDYTIEKANAAAGKEDLVGKTKCYSHLHKTDEPCDVRGHLCPLKIIKKTKKPVTIEHVHYDQEGNPRYHEVQGYPIFDEQGNVVQITECFLDITDRKQAEIGQLLPGRILEKLSHKKDKHQVIRDVLSLIKEFGNFDVVAVRLNEGDDFPYFEVNGFSDSFVMAENHLCVCHDSGDPVCDEQGRPILECLCGKVLRGTTNTSLPCFTEQGSFWTNSTTKFIESISPESLGVSYFRGQCNEMGYESLALIPIRHSGEIVGLLQLGDAQPGRFSIERISYFEQIAASIGIGLARIEAEIELLKQQLFLQRAQEIGRIGTWELDIKKNELRWTAENYKIFGLPVGTKLTYEVFLSRVHPEDRQYVDKTWKAALLNHEPYDIEHRLLIDSKVKWVREKAELVFNDQGECICGTGVTQDISERKEALQQIMDLARFPAENPSPVMRFTRDGMVLYCNSAGEKLLKRWQVDGQYTLNTRCCTLIKKAIALGKPSTAEETIGRRVMSVIFMPILEDNYVNVYCQDVTRLKKTMQFLEEAKGRLQKTVDQQTEALQKTVQNLQSEIQQRVEKESRLCELTEELLHAEEWQRQQIASVLHDSIGALLAFSKCELSELEKKASEALLPTLKKIKDQISKAVQQTRYLTMDLSPPTLRVFGLKAALDELAEEFTYKHSIHCSNDCPEIPLFLDETIKILLYRSVRELLVNIAKHAEAKHVTIQVILSSHNIHIQVEDDGQGFDINELDNITRSHKKSFGLFSIRERLVYMGGTFNIDSQIGRGTRAMLKAPLKMNNKGDKS